MNLNLAIMAFDQDALGVERNRASNKASDDWDAAEKQPYAIYPGRSAAGKAATLKVDFWAG